MSDSTAAKVAMFAICGPAGTGKTQTAVQYLHRKRETFKASLFVSADTEAKLFEGLGNFALKLGLITSQTDSNRDWNKLRDWLETTNEPWLLVLDNAEDVKLINNLWIQSKVGAILITARNPVFRTPTVAGLGCQLPPLSEELAIKMLKDRIEPSVANFNDEEALRIVKNLDFLPLGIVLVIGILNSHHCSLADYNEQWSRPEDVLTEDNIEHINRPFAPYPNLIEKVYNDLLSTLDPDPKAMIQILSYLDPDNIQEGALFDRFRSSDIQSLAKLARFRIKYCGLLLAKSLVTLKEKSTEGNSPISMHRLLQGFLHKSMSPEAVQESFQGATRIVCAAMTHLWQSNFRLIRAEFSEVFPHAQKIHGYFRDLHKELGPRLQLPLDFIRLLHKAGS